MLNSILCFECPSLGEAYRILNQVEAIHAVEILETSWMASGRCFVMIGGGRFDLETMQAPILKEPNVTDLTVLHEIHPSLLEAYFSLLQTPVQNSLLVVEMNSLPVLLHTCHEILQDPNSTGAQLIEIRPYRMVPGPATAVLTGAPEVLQQAQNLIQKLFMTHLHDLNLIKSCHPLFLKFYNLNGEA
jgi:hypothetical protein